jgi:hypothetical protein
VEKFLLLFLPEVGLEKRLGDHWTGQPLDFIPVCTQSYTLSHFSF